MTPERTALLQYRLARARETLGEADLLLDRGYTNACVNRLDYACFYAVSALILTEGYASGKHRGVRALFDRHWIKTGRVPATLGRVYRRLFMRRQRGDYDDLVRFQEAEVRQWVRDARDFVTTICRMVEEQLPSE